MAVGSIRGVSYRKVAKVAFEFHEASCVIVGTFNIYIIRPDWLAKVGLLDEGSVVKFEGLLDRPGFRFSSPKLGANWTVFPNRLVLETESPQENCGETAARILECLPWTPVMAIGFNFVYRGDAQAVEGWKDKTTFPPKNPPDGYKLVQRAWQVAVEHEQQTFNLQMSELESGVEIRSNVHTELGNRDIGFAQETARKFLQHQEESLSMIREVFSARTTA